MGRGAGAGRRGAGRRRGSEGAPVPRPPGCSAPARPPAPPPRRAGRGGLARPPGGAAAPALGPGSAGCGGSGTWAAAAAVSEAGAGGGRGDSEAAAGQEGLGLRQVRGGASALRARDRAAPAAVPGLEGALAAPARRPAQQMVRTPGESGVGAGGGPPGPASLQTGIGSLRALPRPPGSCDNCEGAEVPNGAPQPPSHLVLLNFSACWSRPSLAEKGLVAAALSRALPSRQVLPESPRLS